MNPGRNLVPYLRSVERHGIRNIRIFNESWGVAADVDECVGDPVDDLVDAFRTHIYSYIWDWRKF